jgi:hypothetical protein
MSTQTWHVPVTPSQRFQLWRLCDTRRKADAKIADGQAGRRVRRFVRAFGLHVIDEVVREHSGVRASLASNRKTASLIEVTIENIEECLKLQRVERETAVELELGPLWDLLEACKDGKANDTIAAAPSYDPASENWTPPEKPVNLADAVALLDEVVGFAHVAGLPSEYLDRVAAFVTRFDEAQSTAPPPPTE